MTSDETPKPASNDAAAPSMNKAQAEFARYMNRIHAQQAGGAPAFLMPMGYLPGGEMMPGWAVPPSVAMLPHPGGVGGYAPPFPHGGGAGDNSLSTRLGSTIRLGVDVINAALAGGVRLLGGISGAVYGHGDAGYGHEHCQCPACREGCCASECCGYDCCGGCDPCCSPSVGTCC
jgi:hypothetical protein